MRSLIRNFGLFVLLGAAFTAAGHIYEHCAAATAGTYAGCSVCSDMLGASVDAAPSVDAGLVFLGFTPLQQSSIPQAVSILDEASRAPPGALLS